jgi:bifunctional non-homologous end joining protein LigD
VGVAELRWVPPMLATATRELPSVETDWSAEAKYDGMRAAALLSDGVLQLRSGTGRDITGTFPELGVLAASAARRTLILDGEIIAPGDDGRPDFARLQRRMHQSRPGQQLLATVPVVYIAFDLLHIARRPLLRSPYEQRRALLDSLPIQSAAADIAPAFPGDARAVVAATGAMGLEGIVLKRVGSRYLPGRRSPAWLKITSAWPM